MRSILFWIFFSPFFLQAHEVTTKLIDYKFATTNTTYNLMVFENGDYLVEKLSEVAPREEGRLNEESLVLIKDLVKTFTPAKIESKINRAICMIQAPAYAYIDHLQVNKHFDEETGAFDGLLTLIDGPSGCFIEKSTHPQGQVFLLKAMELKGMLKMIAMNSANLKKRLEQSP